ncbi:hypothetical protein [Adonisia turfae]|uniref:Uncharacterized protein n=1 Tax=Adonisia turfae CCMR0081 TaxID=2292702 RepID=A0A6M0RY76_9CYAN|nr:hypothetical protein [Adonisia turfae]NEZ61144.1 hypothetical protein [Adonisia turfae CCMR0081]
MPPTGKTLSLLSRFPSFYQADGTEGLLPDVLTVFGEILEQADTDLLRVMRSHFVDTADNQGSEGFSSHLLGDLDHILSLYLERLGGTPQLIQVNPQFYPGAIKQLPEFSQKLHPDHTGHTAFAQYLWRCLPRATQQALNIFIATDPKKRTISQTRVVRKALADGLNLCLKDTGLYRKNQEQFPTAILTPAIQQLLQQAPTHGLPLEILNRALIETAFPNEIEKSYAPYRDRLKALIKVLRQGAATKAGIRDIVAANLGIFGNDLSSQAAKAQIQIEEYLPKLIQSHVEIHPFVSIPVGVNVTDDLPLSLEFSIENPNVIPTRPTLRLNVTDLRERDHEDHSIELNPLTQLRFINVETQASFDYPGTLNVGQDNELQILNDGRLLFKGQEILAYDPFPVALPGRSTWRIEAKVRVGEPEGRFDETLFNLSRFDDSIGAPIPLTWQQMRNYGIDITIEMVHKTPGSFQVKVPWDIPGFTDKFGELEDHPRRQIPAIIDQVKAAGVLSVIAYSKRFTEYHALIDWLTVVRSPFTEQHQIKEANFDIGSQLQPYPDGIHHDLTDQLHLSGVFDYTEFNSGNRFA